MLTDDWETRESRGFNTSFLYPHITFYEHVDFFFTNQFMMVEQEHCEQTQQNCVANSIGEELEILSMKLVVFAS